jgi:hypothetical protein
VTMPRAAISSVMHSWLSPGRLNCIRLGLGVTTACWGSAAGIVQRRERSVR